MTSKEFVKGWVLLIAQPWGRRYEGDSEVAQAQREFYFNTVKALDGGRWFQACCTLAGKTEWPAIGAVKSLLNPSAHPGPEQAWAIVAPKVKSDIPTVFMTNEMRTAYGAALALEPDLIAARMAFKETYTQAVEESEWLNREPVWSIISGTDLHSKTLAIQEAVKRGIAQVDWALRQLPIEAHPSLLALAEGTSVKRLA